MPVYNLNKKNLKKFLEALKKTNKLIAPVTRDVARFEEIIHLQDITFDHTYSPAKEFFFKQHEVIFEFEGSEVKVPNNKIENKVFFGLRRCDLNAIRNQDIALGNDAYYNNHRKATTLIGYHCNKPPSKYCFCGSLDLAEFYDLMFFEKKEDFLVKTGSDKGEKLILQHPKLFKLSNENPSSKIPGSDRLKKTDISDLYDNKKWKEGVDICLSCAACTSLCPTCYCFELKDHVNANNPNKGERHRDWSSCQLKSFTRVAGDHIFREDREQRFKHRIYHQLDYFKKKNGLNLCTGCGRCIEHCPTKIDFVDIINRM